MNKKEELLNRLMEQAQERGESFVHADLDEDAKSVDIELELKETEKGRFSVNPVPVYTARIDIHFNDNLTNDPAGKFSMFYADQWGGSEAVEIFRGITHNNSVMTHEINVPKEGANITFVAIGLAIAGYVKVETLIVPGRNTVYLVAPADLVYMDPSNPPRSSGVEQNNVHVEDPVWSTQGPIPRYDSGFESEPKEELDPIDESYAKIDEKIKKLDG